MVQGCPQLLAAAGMKIPMTAVGGAIPAIPSLGGTEAVFPAVPLVASSGIGDGLSPVPEKIFKKTLKLEFMDMKDLLPKARIGR